MYPIIKFVEELHEYLTGHRRISGNIIRRHTKRLHQLGDVSFPLNIKNWSQAIDKKRLSQDNTFTIFDYISRNDDLNVQLDTLLKKSEKWSLIIHMYKIKDNTDVHLYLRQPHAVDLSIKRVLSENCNYGLHCKYFAKKINLVDDCPEHDETKMTLTQLRIVIVQKVASNVLNSLTNNLAESECDIKITASSNEKLKSVLLCGSVLNEVGNKDTKTTAFELYKKRSLVMQLMAQHKYGVQMKSSWGDYFEKLGKASVIIELLENKLHKVTKITLDYLQSTNKGPAFIFYNCARISALLTQFQDHVLNKKYPELPPVDNVDFSLLNQNEEWELVYVYILQFPSVIISCVADIKLGILNLHHLISFLSNLSSVFSVYYRRVKILTAAKEHLLPVLYARIYLIKAVQQVFHTTLRLLNIEPIKEM